MPTAELSQIRCKDLRSRASNGAVNGSGGVMALTAEALRLLRDDDANPPPDEARLARRFARGEPTAFDEVVAVYQPRVERLAHRLLNWRGGAGAVEDAVQDVFLAVLSNARRFRGERGMWPWLATITVNACRTHRRRAWLREKFFRGRAFVADASPPADASAEDREALGRVQRAIDALRPRDREVIVLHCLEEMRIADVATVLGISANAVQVRLHRARQRLLEELKER